MPSIFLIGGRRCRAGVLATAGLLSVCWPTLVLAQGTSLDPEKTAARLFTPAAAEATERGLAFLAAQLRPDGSLGTRGYSRNVAVCSLAGMAFMCGGSTPGRGLYGEHVDRCVAYVLEQSGDSGFLSADAATSHGPMYGHGFATLFLAECYGMSAREDLRDKLDKAVGLIVSTQNSEGGWRYLPERNDADISVTVCQVMALRAARNAGIHVPGETVDRALEYVKRCQNPDGGFRYMLRGGPSLFPRSAAGVVALYSGGIYEGPEIESGLVYIERFAPQRAAFNREGHFFYGHYYAVQAMWHSGGDRWADWYPAVRETMLARQRADGSWIDSICAEYGTAMACIVLQMPNNFLPIFQR